jgi:uncharacterized protein
MLADRIDSGQLAELAARHATWAGHLTTAQLPRVAALLATGTSPQLDVTVTFAPAECGAACLGLLVRGDFELICQRCLDPIEWQAKLSPNLTVLADENDAQFLEDPFESVLMDAEGLRLAQIVEDEVLAAVPLAPMHSRGSECRAPRPGMPQAGDDAASTSRPFAGLAAIMKAGQRPIE